MGIIDVIFGLIGLIFLGWFFDFDGRTREEASKSKMSFEDVCKNSMALSVSQYTLDHVKICGVENVFRLNSDVAKVVNEICKEYDFRLVHTEDATAYHAKIYYLTKI